MDAVYGGLGNFFTIQSRWAYRLLNQRALSNQNLETNEISPFDFSAALNNHLRKT